VSAATVSTAAVAAGLREWTRSHDAPVQAAVWLLLVHEVWPARVEFRDACVRRADGVVWIDWRAAREAFEAGVFARASSAELAVLDLAITLGQDRYRLRSMGTANAQVIAAAVAAAAGVSR
jgi:hypothetical protein